MATQIKTAAQKSNKPAGTKRTTVKKTIPQTKSARFVALLKSGKSIAEVAKITGDGYAFIYGVAKRNGLADKAANRRAVRAVSIDRAAGTVTVQTTEGPVVVHIDGTVVGGHRPVKATKPAPVAAV